MVKIPPLPFLTAKFHNQLVKHMKAGTRPYKTGPEWTDTELANKCDVVASTVMRWRHGGRPGRIKFLILLDVFFGDDPKRKRARKTFQDSYSRQQYRSLLRRIIDWYFPLAALIAVLTHLFATVLEWSWLLEATAEGLDLLLAMFGLMWAWYTGIFDGRNLPEGTLQRRRFDKWRITLANEATNSSAYITRVKSFLDALDDFFGDRMRNEGHKTFFPSWTFNLYDRCLQIGLIYPIAAINIIWGITGAVDISQKK